MSEKNTGMVSFTLDPMNPPTLTAEQEARLHAMNDKDIDLSDIPEQSLDRAIRPGLWGLPLDEVRSKAFRDKVLLLDADVLDLFRESGDASPSKMNAVLREYAETYRKNA